jgi:hypothetical protein
MALAAVDLPYGLRDIKVAPVANDGTVGTKVDLPNAQTLEFNETTSTQELRGDDTVVANRTTVDNVEWTLGAGGLSFEACAVMFGGVVTTTGVTPNVVKKWRRLSTDAYPNFYIEGQAMSESGGDHHTVIHKAKANNFSGSHTDQEFWVTNAEGTGIGTNLTGNLNAVWDLIHNETATAIA